MTDVSPCIFLECGYYHACANTVLISPIIISDSCIRKDIIIMLISLSCYSLLQNLLHRLHWCSGGPVSSQHCCQSQPVLLSCAGELLLFWDKPHLQDTNMTMFSSWISSVITVSSMFSNTVSESLVWVWTDLPPPHSFTSVIMYYSDWLANLMEVEVKWGKLSSVWLTDY